MGLVLFISQQGGSFLVKVMNSDLFRPGVTIFMGDSSHHEPRVHLPCFSPRPVAGIFLGLILVTGQLFVTLIFVQRALFQCSALRWPEGHHLSLLEPGPKPQTFVRPQHARVGGGGSLCQEILAHFPPSLSPFICAMLFSPFLAPGISPLSFQSWLHINIFGD